MEQQRALLDQLLGSNRNLLANQIPEAKKKFFDADVCKYYVSGLCPFYELFKNTKSDLGPCRYPIHEDRYRDEYDALTQKARSKYRYETDLKYVLKEMVREMDRKIKKNRQRAEEENEPKNITEEQTRMLDDLTTRINQHMEASRKYGELSEVERSLQSAREAEVINIEKENLEQRLKFPSGRIMFVCEICGVFINSTDNEARRADHYNGKQYLGWKAIRDKLRELENKTSRLNVIAHSPSKSSSKSLHLSRTNHNGRFESRSPRSHRYEKRKKKDF
eukprot:gnl/TRDRNA2_/TRDRNA2_177860_c0_seq6.p1 gnl/TRDRNA2_/TRDRNA2_177860_c0~~gnl/TRDRNA2_/TRDRNA2_177860_c0_seq6.p1  ORF type:complete len:277 (-),score=1.95 gnl/TRDRNA2_/TRDRNA2_177860_c0_seq6:1267-2097(-)